MRVAVFVLTLLITATSVNFCQLPAANAQAESASRSQALQLFRQGKTAYKAGDYDAALKFFRKAQAIYAREPLIILALAKTFDRDSQFVRARKYYDLFIKEAPPTDPDRGRIIKRIAAIDAKLKARPATLILKGLPSSAKVSINGKDRGVDHRSAVELPAGTYNLKVTMKLRLPFERKEIVLQAGISRTIEVVLVKPVDPSTLPRDHTWTWGAGGATAAALITAGGFFLKQVFVRQEWFDKFNSDGKAKDSTKEEYGCIRSKDTPAECQAMDDEGNRLNDEQLAWQNRAWITAGIAGALAVGTAVAYFAAPVKTTEEPKAAGLTLVPFASHEHVGGILSLRF